MIVHSVQSKRPSPIEPRNFYNDSQYQSLFSTASNNTHTASGEQPPRPYRVDPQKPPSELRPEKSLLQIMRGQQLLISPVDAYTSHSRPLQTSATLGGGGGVARSTTSLRCEHMPLTHRFPQQSAIELHDSGGRISILHGKKFPYGGLRTAEALALRCLWSLWRAHGGYLGIVAVTAASPFNTWSSTAIPCRNACI
jgi:hypothetical protein